jgi:hypothetical protein
MTDACLAIRLSPPKAGEDERQQQIAPSGSPAASIGKAACDKSQAAFSL